MFTLQQLEQAAELVHAAMPATPQYAWPLLAQRTGCEVWVKHENHTPTGAFKMRGGLVYLDDYHRRQPNGPGLISATRGNHGQSLAFAAQAPRRAGHHRDSPGQQPREERRHAGASAPNWWRSAAISTWHARRRAAWQASAGWNSRLSFHPAAGEGRCNLCPGTVSRGGRSRHGLRAHRHGFGHRGADPARDLLGLKTKIVGVVSAEAPAFALSFEAGKVITTPTADTFADGMACRVPPADALDIVRAGADRIVVVGEEEIAEAMRAYFTDTHNMAEGAGAAALAALMQERQRMKGKRVGVILSGGNIDRPVYAGIIAGHSVAQARAAAAA